MTNATIGTVVLALARRAERHIVEALAAQDATSPARAAPLSPDRLIDRRALRRLIRGGAVREESGRYWYDVAGAERFRRYRTAKAVIGLILLGLIVVGLIWWSTSRG